MITFQKERHTELIRDAEVICAFDLGAAGRLGRMEKPVRSSGAYKAVVDHHHFAARDQSVVGVQIDGFAHHAVQLHHGAAPQLQELAHLHGRMG